MSDPAELQAAMTAALDNGQADEIRLVSGHYEGTYGYVSSTDAESLAIVGGYDAGCVSRTGGPTATLLDANAVSRVITVDLGSASAADFALENLTIDSGLRNVVGINDGGGVYVRSAGHVSFTHVHFTDNESASNGGALYVGPSASVSIDRCLFSLNEAGNRGGAVRIFNAADVTVAGSVFDRNASSSDGGAIAFDQDLGTGGDAFTNNSFYSNSADVGGAIYAVLDSESATAVFENNLFNAGLADTTAPDIYLDNDPDGDTVASPAEVAGNAWEDAGNSFFAEAPTLLADNLQVQDPMFTDAAGGDLRPLNTSMVSDRGRAPSVALASSDIGGAPRQQGYAIDVGAYETTLFGGVVATAAPGGDDLGLALWSDPEAFNRNLSVDGASGAYLYNRQLGGSALSARAFVRLPDLNADGVSEIALIVYDHVLDQVQALVRDGAAGTFIRKILYSADYHPVDAVVLAGVNGGGTWGLGVHGVSPEGRQRVQVRDLSSGALVANVDFSAKYTPFGAAAIPDYNGNGVDDIAVLSTQEGNRSLVQIKDGATRESLRIMYFSSAYRPVDFGVTPDVDGGGEPEVAFLGVRAADGDVRLLLKDSVTSVLVKNRRFDPAYAPVAYVYVPDAGSGPGVGVLGRTADGSALRLTLQDAVSGAFLRHMNFDPAYVTRDVAVVSDVDASGADEIVVMGLNGNQAHIQMKDAATAANLIKTEVP